MGQNRTFPSAELKHIASASDFLSLVLIFLLFLFYWHNYILVDSLRPFKPCVVYTGIRIDCGISTKWHKVEKPYVDDKIKKDLLTLIQTWHLRLFSLTKPVTQQDWKSTSYSYSSVVKWPLLLTLESYSIASSCPAFWNFLTVCLINACFYLLC